MMPIYTHRQDGIDDLMRALFHLHEAEGVAAAWAALPDGLWPVVDQLMRIENIGFVRATEVALRTALEIEGRGIMRLIGTKTEYHPRRE